MRKLLLITAALAVSWVPVSAMAAPINYESTSILKLGDFPPAIITGGGVATVTLTSGHIDSLRLIPSRSAGQGDFTQLVTDPETLGNQIFAIDWAPRNVVSGFPFSVRARGDGARARQLFYAFQTGQTETDAP